MKVLITGGAGFIGTHLTRRLLQENCEVTVFDCFDTQIHGENKTLAPDLTHTAQLIQGDVRNCEDFFKALDTCETVVHLAAATGTGQSMYDISHYNSVNIGGTANLFDYLTNHKERSKITKVVTASSRAVYGEGAYKCEEHGIQFPKSRSNQDLKNSVFNPRCSKCQSEMTFVPTPESAPFRPMSFYGLTKQVQEQMTLMYTKTLGIPGYALRYQNVYGPGQSLKNPYTGILAIFSTLARKNQNISIFEDGKESRDFVYIDDTVEATWKCIQGDSVDNEVFNVGSGERTDVLTVAREVASYFESGSKIEVTGAFRDGDIRHNIADLSHIKKVLGFEPKWKFRSGLQKFLAWANEQEVPELNFDKSIQELKSAGLFHED